MTAGRISPVAPASMLRRRVEIRVKRTIDLVGALTLLLILSPLLAAVAMIVRLTSPGPAIFKQQRLGQYQRPFTVYKFRSMRTDASSDAHRNFLFQQANGDCQGVKHFKVIDDGRVTPLGRVLRRLSIDELPQLVNVVKGEMSLVGPRPDLAYSLDIYAPHHFRRFNVLPGMTGLWQVSGRSELSFIDMLDLDVTYADTWSVPLDLVILARTLPEVFAVERAG